MSDGLTDKHAGDTDPLHREAGIARSLYEMARSISSVLALDEVLNRAVRSIVETLGVSHATVFLYDPKLGKGEVVAEHPKMGSLGTQIQRGGNPALGRIETDFSPLIIPDIDRAQMVLGETQKIAQQLGIKSMLIMPVAFQGTLVGAVTIDVYGATRDFSPIELEGMEAIAGQLAVSIRNAQIFEESERRARQLEQITNLSRRVMSTLDRTAILQTVAVETQPLVQADRISVALHWPEESTLYLYLLSDQQAPSVVDFTFGDTALRFVCNTGESLVLDDISGSDYPDYKVLSRHARPDSWESDSPVRSVLIVPLRAGGRIIGTYNLARQTAASFAASDIPVVEQIANQLAIALENARLFAQAESRIQTEQLLNRLGSSLQQSDLQTLILNTTREIAQTIGARRARVRLNTPAAEAVDVARLKKLLDSKSFGKPLRPAEPPVGEEVS